MKYIITALLSAALILLLPGTPVNNSTTTKTKVTHVQAVAPEKATDVKSAPTEQKAVVEPAAVVIPQTQVQGCESYLPLIDKYDWNHDIAFAVMRAENGACDPTRNNAGLNRDGSVDYGLFQVNSIHADMVQGDLTKLYDPATNIATAYRIYSGGGWKAWSTYTSGKYLKYL